MSQIMIIMNKGLSRIKYLKGENEGPGNRKGKEKGKRDGP